MSFRLFRASSRRTASVSAARPAFGAAFNRLAWPNLFAQSAEQISLAAAPLVAVFALDASASDTGLLQTAQTLPFLLLSIPLGVRADRHSRRTLMTAAETVRVAALVAVLALVYTHALSLSLPLLMLLGFLGATGTVAYGVAALALVPWLVAREQLAAANGRVELARSVAYSGGAGVGRPPGGMGRRGFRACPKRPRSDYSRAATASPSALVDASPPMSRVCGPCLSTSEIAATMASCASCSAPLALPRKSSIIAADQIIAIGFAMYWPAMSGPSRAPVRTAKESAARGSGSRTAQCR